MSNFGIDRQNFFFFFWNNHWLLYPILQKLPNFSPCAWLMMTKFRAERPEMMKSEVCTRGDVVHQIPERFMFRPVWLCSSTWTNPPKGCHRLKRETFQYVPRSKLGFRLLNLLSVSSSSTRKRRKKNSVVHWDFFISPIQCPALGMISYVGFSAVGPHRASANATGARLDSPPRTRTGCLSLLDRKVELKKAASFATVRVAKYSYPERKNPGLDISRV